MTKKSYSVNYDVDVVDPYHTSDSQPDRPGTVTVSFSAKQADFAISGKFWTPKDQKALEAYLGRLAIDIARQIWSAGDIPHMSTVVEKMVY